MYYNFINFLYIILKDHIGNFTASPAYFVLKQGKGFPPPQGIVSGGKVFPQTHSTKAGEISPPPFLLLQGNSPTKVDLAREQVSPKDMFPPRDFPPRGSSPQASELVCVANTRGRLPQGKLPLGEKFYSICIR